MNFDALILAGGHSSRMGRPKAWISFNGKPALGHLVDRYEEAGAKRIVVVLNYAFAEEKWRDQLRSLSERVILVLNEEPEKGRMFSIQLGLAALPESENCFVQNVDNPMVSSEVLNILSENSENFEVRKPSFQGRSGHPILLSQNVLKSLASTKELRITLRDHLKLFSHEVLETDDAAVLQNLNTPEDIERWTYELAD